MRPGPPRVEGLHAPEWDLKMEWSDTALFLPPAHALLRRLPIPVELLSAAAHKSRLACDTSKAELKQVAPKDLLELPWKEGGRKINFHRARMACRRAHLWVITWHYKLDSLLHMLSISRLTSRRRIIFPRPTLEDVSIDRQFPLRISQERRD